MPAVIESLTDSPMKSKSDFPAAFGIISLEKRRERH